MTTLLCLFTMIGCHARTLTLDTPKLTADIRMTDIAFHSAALNRDMITRVIAPANIAPGAKLPVVYLLHGAGTDFRDWTNNSDIAAFAAHGILLVMPNADEGYYINEARGGNHRYQDYLITELIPEIHRRFPNAATDRDHTAIIGISRGGFGAAIYALKFPEIFGYAAGLSSAFDLAERPFRWRTPMDSLYFRKVFGPLNSDTRKANDPFLLIRNVTPATSPYFYLTCGDHDLLLPMTERLAAELDRQNIPHELHTVTGDHNWGVWEPQLPALEASLLAHFSRADQP